ncbi:MAG: hypothetical protein AAGP08_00075 [Pseudomonadota bacterium]
MLASVEARLEAEVEDFHGRVSPARDFFALIARKDLPQHDLVAYVIPVGLQGGATDAASGLFRQEVTETVGVITMLQNRGRGAKALLRLPNLIDDVTRAIAGWGPDTAPGVFSLRRGALLRSDNSLVAYQLDFSIQDQLRIAS